MTFDVMTIFISTNLKNDRDTTTLREFYCLDVKHSYFKNQISMNFRPKINNKVTDKTGRYS